MANQLYAKIKKSSKYYYQNKWAQNNPPELGGGFPFPVEIVFDPSGYSVKGGPGGQYRLSDVNFFVIEDGQELKISGR